MKRRFFSALLCAALLVSLAACGGTSTPPDASAQASFAGEWISYASYKNQKAVPYEYFVWSVLYTLNADGSYTAQSTDGSADVTGKWTGGKDGGAVLKRDGRTWTLALLEGSDGVAELREKGSTAASRLVARTDSAVGRAAKKQREAALAASDANGLRTFLAWCSIAEAGGQSFLDADEVLWVDGSDTDALALFGIDPAGVTNGYALYDADEEVFSYSFSDSASFIVYLGGVREGANRSGFITVVKNSGRILARVTTDGESVSAIEQINVP